MWQKSKHPSVQVSKTQLREWNDLLNRPSQEDKPAESVIVSRGLRREEALSHVGPLLFCCTRLERGADEQPLLLREMSGGIHERRPGLCPEAALLILDPQWRMVALTPCPSPLPLTRPGLYQWCERGRPYH